MCACVRACVRACVCVCVCVCVVSLSRQDFALYEYLYYYVHTLRGCMRMRAW